MATLKRLRGVTGEIAKTGELPLIERMRAILVGLGDNEQELEKLAPAWKKAAEIAKPGRSTRSAAASKLRHELGPLVTQLPRESESRRADLARWIVELDVEQPLAQEAVGRKRDPDGEWLDAEQDGWKFGARQVADHFRAANAVTPRIERGVSENPALAAVCGGGNVARGHGFELHSAMSPESLERILRQALRAGAFSSGLLFDRDEVPTLIPHSFVLLTSDTQLHPALDEAVAHGGITEKERADILSIDFGSFIDARGWETVRWRTEAELSALLLYRMRRSNLPEFVQPCLSAGHCNWVCLRFLGTTIPNLGWREQTDAVDGGRTTARKDEARLREAHWRAAHQTLWGCRSWMISEARAGRDPSWVRAMQDEEGKVKDENLLKATLVCELLQQEGRLFEVMKATSDKKEPIPAFEAALGEPIPEFEARWRRWLLQERTGGVLQELERSATTGETESPFAAALRALNQARAEALEEQAAEAPEVSLDAELCRAAELHARYLTLNPGQRDKWPAVHEEYADAAGFTPDGALAGGRSVIAFDGDPVRSVKSWLDTFYHRLPLLSPGLFGAGFGMVEDVVVLDVGSLVLDPWHDHVVVWPASGAMDVPRRFTPEMPNPVPGAEMAELGYAVTLQLYLSQVTAKPNIKLELFAGDPESKNAVDCHVITPDAPLFIDLAPDNAWALIPKRSLQKNTRYTARATWNATVKLWNFTTGD